MAIQNEAALVERILQSRGACLHTDRLADMAKRFDDVHGKFLELSRIAEGMGGITHMAKYLKKQADRYCNAKIFTEMRASQSVRENHDHGASHRARENHNR